MSTKPKPKPKPIGPSSDDFHAWLSTRPDMQGRIELGGMNKISAYEIWRNAWLACEREHGIRKSTR